jgi:Tfp pilus assembly protein PilZ
MAEPVPAKLAPSSPRPSVIQLAIKEKAALYAAYIPLFPKVAFSFPPTRNTELGMTFTCCCRCPTSHSAIQWPAR